MIIIIMRMTDYGNSSCSLIGWIVKNDWFSFVLSIEDYLETL